MIISCLVGYIKVDGFMGIKIKYVNNKSLQDWTWARLSNKIQAMCAYLQQFLNACSLNQLIVPLWIVLHCTEKGNDRT